MVDAGAADGVRQSQWKCGIVRPISDMDGYSSQHWSDLHTIVCETLIAAGFEPRLVSEADEIGVIQGRIVKNLYEADLVVCDVSGKNPNVMFELGLRLAFDKPTIVIKDEITSFSFDTSPIEHIPYPKDLRYNLMIEFKEQLSRKAIATVKAPDDPGYTSFLQHFGPIRVPSFEHQEVPVEQYMLDEIREMKFAVSRLASSMLHQGVPSSFQTGSGVIIIPLEDLNEAERTEVSQKTGIMHDVIAVRPATIEGKSGLSFEVKGAFPLKNSKTVREIESIIAQIRARPQSD